MLPNPITHQIHQYLSLVHLYKKTSKTQTAYFVYGLSGLNISTFYFTLTLWYTPFVPLWGILSFQMSVNGKAFNYVPHISL